MNETNQLHRPIEKSPKLQMASPPLNRTFFELYSVRKDVSDLAKKNSFCQVIYWKRGLKV